MTQDERWQQMWNAYMKFMKRNKHCPSKYKDEDKALVNWAKYNRKQRNKGLLSPTRLAKFKELCDMATQFRRVNQHAYLSSITYSQINEN